MLLNTYLNIILKDYRTIRRYTEVLIFLKLCFSDLKRLLPFDM